MKRLDLTGGKFNIVHENSSNLQTNFGACLSIIVAFLLALSIYAFGYDFFLRSNPKASVSTGSPYDYPLYTLNNHNFSFAFRFEDWNGIQVQIDDEIFISAYYSHYERDNITKEFKEIEWYRIPVFKCTKEMFSSERFANTAGVDNLLCMDLENKTFGGNWDGDYVYNFYIYFEICEEGDNNPYTNQPCKPNSEKEKIIPYNYLMLDFFYQYTIIDTSSYDNALYTVIKSDYFKVNKMMQKTKYYTFKETQLKTDYGWLLENLTQKSVLGFTNTNTDYTIKDQDEYKGIFGQVILYGSREVDTINRNYEKIQTLIAEVGGVIKFIMFLFAFIGNRYANNFTVLKLSNLIEYDHNSQHNMKSNCNLDINNRKITQTNPIAKNNYESSELQINASRRQEGESPKQMENFKLNNNIAEVNSNINNINNSQRPLNTNQLDPQSISFFKNKNNGIANKSDINKDLNINNDNFNNKTITQQKENDLFSNLNQVTFYIFNK